MLYEVITGLLVVAVVEEGVSGPIEAVQPLVHRADPKAALGVFEDAAHAVVGQAGGVLRVVLEEVDLSVLPVHAVQAVIAGADPERVVAPQVRITSYNVCYTKLLRFRWLPEKGWPVAFVSPGVAALGYDPGDLLSRKILFADMVRNNFV